jgi:hypothetical protein
MSTIAPWFDQFLKQAVQPVHTASLTESIGLATGGLILLVAAVVLARRSRQLVAHERVWTERCLQGALGFGTVLFLLAFVRYEGIPYLSMTAVLWLVGLWLVGSVVQLVLYRTSVLKPARIQWHQRKAHEQYLPKPKRSAR